LAPNLIRDLIRRLTRDLIRGDFGPVRRPDPARGALVPASRIAGHGWPGHDGSDEPSADVRRANPMAYDHYEPLLSLNTHQYHLNELALYKP
jgi:hypothetical protein